jgi:UDPglucose 6-dehydrogenase
MKASKRRICVIGTGYVGVASAIGFSELGHDVVGYDVMKERIHGLADGVTPYREEGLATHLRRNLERGNLRFVDDLEEAVRGAEFIIICVGTPSLADGSADLGALDGAVRNLQEQAISEATIVVRSTVPCGTTEAVAEAFRGYCRVLFAPEFLREGHAFNDFMRPDRIVIGAEDEATANGYAALFEAVPSRIFVMSFRDAELVKMYANAFLAMKISFANEVAVMCDATGTDALNVLLAIGADQRIGERFLQPGIGFGGPCFEKDLKSLRAQALQAGAAGLLVEATLRVNENQTRRTIDILQEELGSLRDRRIAVWGLTFKAGTDDVRDSLAVRIVEELRRREATVVAHDPAVQGFHPMIACEIVDTPLEAVSNADALVIATEWPEFRAVDSIEIARRLRSKVVVDGRNVLDSGLLAAAGVTCRGIGRRSYPCTARDRAEAV